MFARIASAVLFLLTVQGAPAAAQELRAYVGAGLRQPVDALIAAFAADTGITVRAEYGGSGQLLARLEETGKGDLFIPGSTVFTDTLRAKGAVTSVDRLVVHGPVVAVAPDKAASIQTFADLAKPGVRVGLGDPQAMALGRTAEQILDRSGLGDAIRANVTVRAATVKQLALYVLDGDVDAAIIGVSDVAQNPGKLVAVAIPTDWFDAEYVAVAVLASATQPEAARRFAAFLGSAKGLETFKLHGFPPAPKP